jgi:hypothetical protein
MIFPATEMFGEFSSALCARPASFTESGTMTTIAELGSSPDLGAGAVLSEQERIVARIADAAKPALRTLKDLETPVERRIVTLMKRVTY